MANAMSWRGDYVHERQDVLGRSFSCLRRLVSHRCVVFRLFYRCHLRSFSRIEQLGYADAAVRLVVHVLLLSCHAQDIHLRSWKTNDIEVGVCLGFDLQNAGCIRPPTLTSRGLLMRPSVEALLLLTGTFKLSSTRPRVRCRTTVYRRIHETPVETARVFWRAWLGLWIHEAKVLSCFVCFSVATDPDPDSDPDFVNDRHRS